jgi:DNA helicase-2/ATP-dependent DNA helicase PcrA
MLCLSKPGYHPNLLTSRDKNKIIKECLLKIIKSHKDEIRQKEDYAALSADDYAGILSEIARIKNDNCSPSECNRDVPYCDFFEEIYNSYIQSCSDLGFIDFEDMILECYRMLVGNPDILAKWQKSFRYVLIDE